MLVIRVFCLPEKSLLKPTGASSLYFLTSQSCPNQECKYMHNDLHVIKFRKTVMVKINFVFESNFLA